MEKVQNEDEFNSVHIKNEVTEMEKVQNEDEFNSVHIKDEVDPIEGENIEDTSKYETKAEFNTIYIKEEFFSDEEVDGDVVKEATEDPFQLGEGCSSPSMEPFIEISTPDDCVDQERKLETCEEPNSSNPLSSNINLSSTYQVNNIKCKIIQMSSSDGAGKKHSRQLCAFKGCGRAKAAFPSLHFFHFPVHRPYICQSWITNCANEVLNSLDKKTLSRKHVCEKHFENKCFTSTMKRRLNPYAVPTVTSSKYDNMMTEPKQGETLDIVLKEENETKELNTIYVKEEMILSDEEVGGDVEVEATEDPLQINEGKIIQMSSSDGAGKKHSRQLCAFKGCGRAKAAFPSLHFFHFPVHRPYICQSWITNCANEVLKSLEKKTLSRKEVCEKHFENKCFTSPMKRRLNPHAVPTVPSSKYDNMITEPKQGETLDIVLKEENETKELNTIYIKEEMILSDEEVGGDVEVEATEDPLQINEDFSCVSR